MGTMALMAIFLRTRNIQNNLTDDDSSSDNEGECLGIFRN